MDAVAIRLDAARVIARDAGALAMRFWRDRARLTVEFKGTAQDMVSAADRAVEDLIRAEVTARFPGDGFQGEEGGSQPCTSGFVWVIDPIDGTSPFLAGLPHWCVTIAVREGARTVIGVTETPPTGEQFVAHAGHGAWLDGQRLRLDPARRLSDSVVALGASDRTPPTLAGDMVRRVLEAGGMVYRNGSGARMLADVAAGRLGGYMEPHMHPWDALAGLLLIAEAGGRVAPFPGDGTGGLVMGCAPGLWDDMSAMAALATGATHPTG